MRKTLRSLRKTLRLIITVSLFSMHNKILKTFLLFVFLFSYSSLASAYFSFNDNCKSAYKEILNFKLGLAQQKLEEEKLSHPSNAISYYLNSYIDFIKAFVNEEEASLIQFKNNTEIRLKQMEKDDEKSPYYLFTQAEINLQSAFLRLKFKEYITAAYEIRKAYKLLEKNVLLFPDFLPNKKSLGFLHAVIGAVPDDYKWLVGIIGMNGSIKQGVLELDEVIASEKMDNPDFRIEALIIKAFIEINLQKNKKEARDIGEELITENAENNSALLSFVNGNIAMRTGNNDQAINIFLSKPNKDRLPFYYIDYLTGIAKLNRLDKDADVYFEKFIKNFKGRNYIKAAYQKLGWYYLINGNIDMYKRYMTLVINHGHADIDEDIQALKEAQSGQIPHVVLLKSRLLSDGGYYQQAIVQIALNKNDSYLRLKDQLEVTYRMGRIYHELGNMEKAIEYYRQTLKNGQSFSYYYASNAALQLGLIYETHNNFSNALLYYNKCLSMKKHEYQNSIDQKAKVGVSRVSR